MLSTKQEYQTLVQKKDQLASDKAQIVKFISELDEKKNKAVKDTYVQVNKHFGSIFTSLLRVPFHQLLSNLTQLEPRLN